MLQIEHWDSIEHLEEIMEVPGINMLRAGPCDLSGSLGKLALVDDPECKKWYDLLVEKAIKKDSYWRFQGSWRDGGLATPRRKLDKCRR